MKKILCTSLVLTLLIQTSWAQQSCPLTNSKLSDLRTAASKLAKTITLSAECKSYQDTVNQANAELKKVADQIAAIDDVEGEEEKPDLKDAAVHAVTQLDTINTVFKDKRCGEELVGFLDYAEAFVDVANGMAPFLALYGGTAAMPWVLGPALGGAAAKALITFFKNKSINMRNPDQSNMFIKNSCSFYNLDLIKNSIDDLQLNQFTRIEKELVDARRKLENLQDAAPREPDSQIVTRIKKAEKDKEKIKYLQDQFKADPYEACIYIGAYASHQDGPEGDNLVHRVWNNYEETIKESPFRLDLEKSYFVHELNLSATSLDSENCKELGLRWLNKMDSLSGQGITHLTKLVSEQPDVVAFENWKTEKSKVEENVKVLEAKIKFFQEMTSDGFNIEYSEIIRSHEIVQDSIFSSYKYLAVLKMKGLAEAWLRVKQEDAHEEYQSFFKRKKEVEKRINKIVETVGIRPGDLSPSVISEFANNYFSRNRREHNEVHNNVLTDVCNQLRQTWASWYNGLVHSRAGKDYCVTFDKVINKLDYPGVQKLCFGTSSRVGHRLNSLKNQVRDFMAIKPHADEVAEKMKELSCSQRGELTQDLLKLPLE